MGRKKKGKPLFIPPPTNQLSVEPHDSRGGKKSGCSKTKPNKGQDVSADGNEQQRQVDGDQRRQKETATPSANRETEPIDRSVLLGVQDSGNVSTGQLDLSMATATRVKECISGPPGDSVLGNKSEPLTTGGKKSANGTGQQQQVGGEKRQEHEKATHEAKQKTETIQYSASLGDKESGNHSTGIAITQHIVGNNVQIGDGNTLIDRREDHSAGAEAAADSESACEFSSDVERIDTKEGTRHTYEHSSVSDSSHTEIPVEWETRKCKKKKKKRQKTYAAALGVDATEKSNTRTQSNTTQNIKAEHVVTNIKITQHVREATPKSSELKARSSTFRAFLEAVGDFKKGHNILVTGKTEQLRNLDVLSLVPWSAVFDLDPDTRSTGLLSNVEEKLKNRRALHVLSWNETCSVTERSTNWVSVRGFSERPDTLANGNHKEWKKEIKEHFESQLKQLKEFQDGYTRFRVIVLWPDDNSIIHHMNYLLTEIEEALNPSFVVLDEGNEKTDIARSVLTTIEDAFGEKMKRITISLGDVCKAISSKLSKPAKEGSAEYLLPTSDRTNNPDICAEKAQFLGEDLEVLYINNDTGEKLTQKEIHEQQDIFFKGGSLPWSWWYDVGPGHVDIERDVLHEMTEYIKREHIEFCKSGRITLYHAPGSGGTTLAQRLLWELRREVPCAQVKHRTGTVATDVISKVQFLSDKTHLPIILLIDGEEEQKVDHIERLGGSICMLVIYVKRYTLTTDETNALEGEFWLTHGISEKEGKRLGIKCIQQCKTDHQKNAVNILLADIHKGDRHSLVEFGLAMHSYEYHGIEGFVKGFLKLDENDKTLMPWQEALAFLSLVHYYGQITIPCQLFSELLGKDDKEIFQFEDFPEGMKGLIVTDPHEGKANVVRICHYYVAKEILDQLLPWPSICKKIVSPKICAATKQKLEPFVIDLITLAAKQSTNNASYNINKIMTRTFISRDNQPCGEKDTVPKKPKLSAVLEDVGDRPPYTERFTVLEHLTNSFPTNAQFRAHLGRLYTLCRPEEDEKAEKCFNEALQICRKDVAGKTVEEIPHSMKLTLMHIYHMYGVMFSTKVSKFTGKHLGDRPVRKRDDTEFIETATMLLSWVETACENFSNCRLVTPRGCEESFLFSGEIQVKLMLCDFINAKSGCSALLQFDSDRDLSKFIQDCFVELQDLFLELFSVINPEKIDQDVWKNQRWYAALFKTSRPGHCRLRTDDQISSERMNIAITKMQYSNNKTYGTLELVTNATDVRKIVEGYELIFKEADALAYKNTSKRTMDHDHREWLFAIRLETCPNRYTVERVLKRVQTWYDALHTPYSIFYLFVLKSILGFGRDGTPGYTQLLVEAQELKEEMLKRCKYIPKPRFPREWLGNPAEESIRQLAPGRRFIGQVINGKEAQQRMALVEDQCETMTGTILRPNDRPASGYIDLDLGRQNRVPVKVFYVPVVAEMKGTSYADTRVEFIIGFSMSHGYEAFYVHKLSRVQCVKCEKSAEIKSTDKYVKCSRCKSKIWKAARPKRQ